LRRPEVAIPARSGWGKRKLGHPPLLYRPRAVAGKAESAQTGVRRDRNLARKWSLGLGHSSRTGPPGLPWRDHRRRPDSTTSGARFRAQAAVATQLQNM